MPLRDKWKAARREAFFAVLMWGLAGLLLAGPPMTAEAADMPADAASAPYSTPSEPSPGIKKQDRKLDLEIKRLEEETSTRAYVRSWLPASSSIIALVAVGFGAYQYFRDRRRESYIHIQDKFSTNLGTVAEYVRDDTRTSARLLTALSNLKEGIVLTNAPESYRSKVTTVIATEAAHDVDFDDPVQARFDLLCLDEWPDYKRWLRDHPRQQRFVLYRYMQAMRALAGRHAAYFKEMRVGEDGSFRVRSYIDERDFLHFQQLLMGIRGHLESQATEDRQAGVSDLGEAIGNPALAEQLLAADRPAPDRRDEVLDDGRAELGDRGAQPR